MIFLTKVGDEVQVETHLQANTLEQFPLNVKGGARSDITITGYLGGNYERIFLDVKVINPYAPSNHSNKS